MSKLHFIIIITYKGSNLKIMSSGYANVMKL